MQNVILKYKIVCIYHCNQATYPSPAEKKKKKKTMGEVFISIIVTFFILIIVTLHIQKYE